MVQGTSSSAGKSFLVTALCRILARRGIRAAPFNAVNMSNNARVVNGLEMPTAQYFQAIAAGIEPDVRMAPILVKPEAGGSQVVVMGKVDRHLSAMAWQDRPVHQWPVVTSALRWVQDNYDVVVIEGAGSPAEVNLRALDVVNMAIARQANAAVPLVADIDRGGSFAHLYGTWALLNQDEQRLVRGYILNKFRGDPRLLAGGPERLEHLTGVPTVAVVPWVAERLPEEDAFGWRNDSATTGFRVAVVAYPSISNLDEFRSLEETATVDLIRPSEWAEAVHQTANSNSTVGRGEPETADVRRLKKPAPAFLPRLLKSGFDVTK
ncbi:MAG: cobyric acid synthase [Acidobacteria bacterium]|nr:cobyric acid synthase [Acidobacteriota bacterium]